VGLLRYQSTTGLDGDQIEELAARIWQITHHRERQERPPSVGLYRAIMLTLLYVRQNLNQGAVGDLFGVAVSPNFPPCSESSRRSNSTDSDGNSRE
jgi:hypothetical protein